MYSRSALLVIKRLLESSIMWFGRKTYSLTFGGKLLIEQTVTNP